MILDESNELSGAAFPKDFVHIRINVCGSPLECPGFNPSIPVHDVVALKGLNSTSDFRDISSNWKD